MNNKTNTAASVEADRSLWSIFAKAVGLIMGVAIAYIVLYMAYKDGTTYYQTPSYTNPSMDAFAPSLVPTTAPNSPNGIIVPSNGNDIPHIDLTKTPQTKEEIVEYYKSANHKVKTQAKSVTRTYNKVSNYNNVLETGSNPILSRIGKAVMGKFLTENLEPKPLRDKQKLQVLFRRRMRYADLMQTRLNRQYAPTRAIFLSLKYICFPRLTP